MGGLPLFIQEASKLEARGQVVSPKFFRHVLMFLQLAEGQGFPDRRWQSFLRGGEKKITVIILYHGRATVKKTTQTGFSFGFERNSGKIPQKKKRKKKRSHRRRVENKAAFLSELTRANPHMHDAGSSRLKGRTLGPECVPRAHSAGRGRGGWAALRRSGL